MCEPVTLGALTAGEMAAGGLSIASGLMGGYQKMQAGKANNRAVMSNYGAQMGMLGQQQTQMQQQAEDQKSHYALQAESAMGGLSAGLSDAGVEGNTADRLRTSVQFAGESAQGRVQQNLSNGLDQSNNQGFGLRAQAQSQMKNENFDWMGSTLQIAQGIVPLYMRATDPQRALALKAQADDRAAQGQFRQDSMPYLFGNGGLGD